MSELPTQHAEARSEPFGYTCHACSRCCHHKLIQTNPYEVARLARNRGVSTGEFAARWTVDGQGTHLAQTADGACVFLGDEGCTVHPDRPLVCRLYPLGRRRMADGSEAWQHMEPHPETEGVYSRDGTIAGYLEQQDAQPFILAADAYAEWVNTAREKLAIGALDAPGEAGDAGLPGIDEALEAWCAEHGEAAPAEIEKRKDLHLEILYELLETTGGGDDGEEAQDHS